MTLQQCLKSFKPVYDQLRYLWYKCTTGVYFIALLVMILIDIVQRLDNFTIHVQYILDLRVSWLFSEYMSNDSVTDLFLCELSVPLVCHHRIS
jgi:hypothetical protein